MAATILASSAVQDRFGGIAQRHGTGKPMHKLLSDPTRDYQARGVKRGRPLKLQVPFRPCGSPGWWGGVPGGWCGNPVSRGGDRRDGVGGQGWMVRRWMMGWWRECLRRFGIGGAVMDGAVVQSRWGGGVGWCVGGWCIAWVDGEPWGGGVSGMVGLTSTGQSREAVPACGVVSVRGVVRFRPLALRSARRGLPTPSASSQCRRRWSPYG